MKRLGLGLLLTVAAAVTPLWAQEGDGKLRVIAFGAHPDDCDSRAGRIQDLRRAPGAALAGPGARRRRGRLPQCAQHGQNLVG